MIERLRTNGWEIVPDLIDRALLERLREDFENALVVTRQIQVTNGIATATAGTANHLVGLGDSFLEFIRRGYLHSELEAFFRGPYILNIFGGVSNFAHAASYVTNIHRDTPYFSGDFPLQLQFLVMLDDFTEENGATYFMEGGHRRKDRPSEQEFFSASRRAVGRAGSLVVFDGNIWHAAGANTSSDKRRGLTLIFTPPFVKQQLDLPRFLGTDFALGLDSRTAQILGFNARTPANLEEWYQPPERRLYKRDQKER